MCSQGCVGRDGAAACLPLCTREPSLPPLSQPPWSGLHQLLRGASAPMGILRSQVWVELILLKGEAWFTNQANRRSHPLGHCHLLRGEHLAKQSPFAKVCKRYVIRYHSLSGILNCKDQGHLGLPSATAKGGKERRRKRERGWAVNIEGREDGDFIRGLDPAVPKGFVFTPLLCE